MYSSVNHNKNSVSLVLTNLRQVWALEIKQVAQGEWGLLAKWVVTQVWVDPRGAAPITILKVPTMLGAVAVGAVESAERSILMLSEHADSNFLNSILRALVSASRILIKYMHINMTMYHIM